MIRIEVVHATVDERKGVISRGERKGQDYHIRNQEAYLHNGHAYPDRFSIALGDQPPYAPGFYTLAPTSITVGEYGDLQMARRLVLLREEAEATPKLAAAK